MAEASTTSRTGASSSRATSAVDDRGAVAGAVEQAHHAFDDQQVAARAGPGGQGRHGLGPAEPGVEVAGRAARGQGVVAGVDEVGADLGGGRAVAGRREGGHQPGGDRGLAHSGVGAGHHQPGTEGGAAHATRLPGRCVRRVGYLGG